MPFEIKCAYRVVIDLIYMQNGDLPDDARYISGLLGCSIRKWKSIRKFLIEAGKLQVSGDFLASDLADSWKIDAARPAIPTELRNYVFERDGGQCVYCDSLEGPFELDHVNPWSRGGDHEAGNLVVSCRACNRKKGNRTPIEMGWACRQNEWGGTPNWEKETVQ